MRKIFPSPGIEVVYDEKTERVEITFDDGFPNQPESYSLSITLAEWLIDAIAAEIEQCGGSEE